MYSVSKLLPIHRALCYCPENKSLFKDIHMGTSLFFQEARQKWIGCAMSKWTILSSPRSTANILPPNKTESVLETRPSLCGEWGKRDRKKKEGKIFSAGKWYSVPEGHFLDSHQCLHNLSIYTESKRCIFHFCEKCVLRSVPPTKMSSKNSYQLRPSGNT